VELSISLPELPLVVVADPGQIEQVLMNLCTNARDAMPRGGQLTVSGTEVTVGEEGAREGGLPRAGRYARVDVKDTGQGMSGEVRERIFEPFFTTKEHGKGTGLGLAIVYGIVRQHDGHVSVNSAIGVGTTVSVFLPIHEGPVEARPDAAPARPPATSRGETILLAEDEPLVRRVLRTALERAGYRVLEAADGHEAVALFAAAPDTISLCVFDVVMPHLNGREAREQVERLRPGTPVLLASGHAADVLEGWGVGEDAPELIAKPVTPQVLLAKVREMLDRAAEARAGNGRSA
jgi:CheY-like chemotaxis protein